MLCRLAGLLTAALLAANIAIAQTYPDRPVRWIVPFPPGGSSDTVVRVIGQKLQESPTWGQPLVIMNRPGGNTIVAAREIAQQTPPDGYTLFSTVDSTMTMNHLVIKDVGYNPQTDFTPITMLFEQPLLISVNPNKMKSRNMRELVQEVKQAPGKYNLGTGALVTQGAAALLKSVTGMDILLVPYRGGAETLQSILSGTIEIAMSDTGAYVGPVSARKLVPIAVTSSKRSPALPDVPTLAESGYPEVDVRSWNALYTPSGVPREIAAKLNQEVTRILRMPDVTARLATLGLDAAPSTPEELTASIRSDTARWEKVLSTTPIMVQ
jgi:tripartite-type tricarboxylate transporter receptor subunit TctC